LSSQQLSVNLTGAWRLYTTTLPANSIALGTVTRDGYDTGALVRLKSSGCFVQVNAGVMRNLDGRKVGALLGLMGRHQEVDNGRRVNVFLDEQTIKKAKEIGNGSISYGIRLAIKDKK
jgi:hypothetical protein